ncbi:MAG: cystathionine gamma-synthase [Planctomycetota bacterium]|nr:MAG: cystathionine gamma-synthase [Planctomycetota bacterium]
MKFATKAIHIGQDPDPTTGAIVPPIYQTSTYVQEYPAQTKGYEYSRTANPTRCMLEKTLAALENASYARAFASGMAACDAILKLLKQGDHIIASQDLYGGTYRLFTKIFTQFGLEFTFLPSPTTENFAQAIQSNTRLIWVESPSNPLLTITDLAQIAQLGKKHQILTVADNTFATPYLQNPLDLGIDIVSHSTTKYLGGHSDVVGGAVMTNSAKLDEQLGFIQNSSGAVPGPWDCYLVSRGIKTLALRMERHCQNAQAIAQFLQNSPYIQKVYYPGLNEHPQHRLAKKQMRGFGGMISCTLKGDLEQAKTFITRTKIFKLAESLGAVESLIEHPASMTHASIPKEEREKTGFTDNLVRLSVGVEDKEDLIADLEQALKKTFA